MSEYIQNQVVWTRKMEKSLHSKYKSLFPGFPIQLQFASALDKKRYFNKFTLFTEWNRRVTTELHNAH